MASNWKDFACDYRPFTEARQLKALLEKSEPALSDDERETLTRLSQKYRPGSARFKHLVEHAASVQQDLPRLLISRAVGDDASARAFNA
ncbi:hypothetical protein ACPV51_25030, partial [Vibrio astriarenae]